MRFSRCLIVVGMSLVFMTGVHASNDCSHIKGLKDTKTISCGFVTVPEDHSKPEGKKIEIAYAVIRSEAKDKRPDPVVFLSGGPGSGTLNAGFIGFMRSSPLIKKRDIVLFDQRGIQHSSALPDVGKGVFDAMAANVDLKGERELIAIALSKTQKEADSQDRDLGSYNTFQNASDIAVVMKTLGYKKYNLFGISYGTRLGRAAQDLFPERLNAVILDSPNPMTDDFLMGRIESFSAAADKVIKACDSDEKCRKEYPNLKREYFEVVRNLDRNPLKIEYDNSVFWVNSQDAMYFLRRQLYRNNAVTMFPAFVRALKEKKVKLIADAIRGERADVTNGTFNSSMFLAVSTYESMDPRNTNKKIDELYSSLPHFPAKLGFFTNLYLEGMSFHSKSLPVKARKFKRSKIPTMIFVNQYDPVTPPENGALFQRDLERSKLYILDEAGHSGGDFPCKMKVMVEFMNDPAKDPDTSCLKLFK